MNSQISDELKVELINKLVDNLTVFRAKLGITQGELALRIGGAQNSLNKIENRKRDMTWVTFVALIMLFIHNEETKPLVETFHLFPQELEDFLLFKKF